MRMLTGADATAHVASFPANVLIYGPPGTKKTTDSFEAFTTNGVCRAIAMPCEDGALKILASRGMPIPAGPDETVKTWAQVEAVIGWAAQNRGQYSAVVIDGLTALSTNLYNEATATIKSKNKFDIPVKVRAQLFQLRDWIRLLGMHCVMIAHAMPPALLDGVFYPGSFQLTPKTVIGEYFGQVDTVLRVGHIQPLGRAPFRVYFTGGERWPDELATVQPPVDMHAWKVKNREGVDAAVVPADLASFLRQRQPPYVGL